MIKVVAIATTIFNVAGIDAYGMFDRNFTIWLINSLTQ